MCLGGLQNPNGTRVPLPHEVQEAVPQFNDGIFETINSMVGKEVYIYPGDTVKKTGIIVDMNAVGVLFKITSTDDMSTWKQYEVGKLYFISYASGLMFREV